jgi:SAM-dependent methyltransferase
MDLNERERIRTAYEKRKKIIAPRGWANPFEPGKLFLEQQLQRKFLALLKREGLHYRQTLENSKILDVGCGPGARLMGLVHYGARPENCFGIDLVSYQLELGKLRYPNFNLIQGDGSSLPFGDETFDMIYAFTLFTSILDTEMKAGVAREIVRVMKPDGVLFWWDFFITPPRSKDTHGVGKAEIRRLFPGCQIKFKRVTLALPLALMFAPYAWLLCCLMEKIPLFRTHYLGTIKKTVTIAQRGNKLYSLGA